MMITIDKDAVLSKIRQNFRWSFVFTALSLLALGIILLLYPVTAMRLLCYVVAAILLLFGRTKIIAFIQEKGRRFSLELIIGIVTAALGLFILISPSSVLHAIQIILGLTIIIDSLLGIRRALALRTMGMKWWTAQLVVSIAAIVFALLLMIWREIFGDARVIVMGVLLIFQGICDLTGLLSLNYFGNRLWKKLDSTADTDDDFDA